jgi:hypothetical protein
MNFHLTSLLTQIKDETISNFIWTIAVDPRSPFCNSILSLQHRSQIDLSQMESQSTWQSFLKCTSNFSLYSEQNPSGSYMAASVVLFCPHFLPFSSLVPLFWSPCFPWCTSKTFWLLFPKAFALSVPFLWLLPLLHSNCSQTLPESDFQPSYI